MNLSNSVAVITGGSSGIGLACCELFLAADAAVAFCGRDQQRLEKARLSLIAKYPHARLFAAVCDVLDPTSVQNFSTQVEKEFGKANILVNNAGQGRVSTFADTTDVAWMEELQLKYFSVIHPVRAFLSQLQSSPNASIVCVNSLLAVQPEPHMVATSSARAGIANLVRSLAVEFAPQQIRVNGIFLGLVESGQWHRRFDARPDQSQSWEHWSAELAKQKEIPLRRLGKPAEAAQAIFFLASPMSSYTTGSHIDISGGLSRHA